MSKKASKTQNNASGEWSLVLFWPLRLYVWIVGENAVHIYDTIPIVGVQNVPKAVLEMMNKNECKHIKMAKIL